MDLHTGIVRKVEPINENLTIITLESLSNNKEKIVPIYMTLDYDYQDLVVAIWEFQSGFSGLRMLKQTISSERGFSSRREIEIPYALVEKIMENYKKNQ